MAKFVLTSVKTLINGVDFSDHLASVTIDMTSDEVETTAFGGGSGFRTRVAGLKDASITLSFHNDFGTSGSDAVDSTIYSLWNAGANATVVVTPTSGSVSSSNPSYSGLFLVSQANPISGSVGDLATRDVTWPVSGTGITRGTV